MNAEKITIDALLGVGYDTDTAGILYGRDGIPQRWMDRLQKRDELEQYARDFAACYSES